ncbi:uncharacterized protein LOC141674087 [Apium graveolens]|uniref:uncharacterized protein LOC141674087 n=1 Tax=Apium graveolens TaxID=4045 RepID=UPI003D7BCAF4
MKREENTKADELSKRVQNSSDMSSSVYFEELLALSIEKVEILCDNSPENWKTPFIANLKHGTLPGDKNKARYLKHKATHFFLKDDQLYRRTFSASTLKCVDLDETDYYLLEVHKGICRDQLAKNYLAYKVIWQGYYWPIIHTDAIVLVKKYKQCQIFSNVPKQSLDIPALVFFPIPFAIWGIDIMGPFPRAKGDLRYVLIAIDYMMKWA